MTNYQPRTWDDEHKTMPSGIVCKWCGSQKSKVIDSRKRQNTIFRTRECTECNRHWITIESFLYDIAWKGKEQNEDSD